MQLDHPLTRKSLSCPICDLVKGDGLVVCWSCYRLHNVRNGNMHVDLVLNMNEQRLDTAARMHAVAIVKRMQDIGRGTDVGSTCTDRSRQ